MIYFTRTGKKIMLKFISQGRHEFFIYIMRHNIIECSIDNDELIIRGFDFIHMVMVQESFFEFLDSGIGNRRISIVEYMDEIMYGSIYLVRKR